MSGNGRLSADNNGTELLKKTPLEHRCNVRGLISPIPLVFLGLYPALLWSIQKLGTIAYELEYSGIRVQKLPSLIITIISLLNALYLVYSSRWYYMVSNESNRVLKWEPSHSSSWLFCLFSPFSIMPLVWSDCFASIGVTYRPEIWLVLAILHGYIQISLFHLFFLRESIDKVLFNEAYRIEVDYREKLAKARREAERQVFEKAGLYNPREGKWNAGARQIAGGRQR